MDSAQYQLHHHNLQQSVQRHVHQYLGPHGFPLYLKYQDQLVDRVNLSGKHINDSKLVPIVTELKDDKKMTCLNLESEFYYHQYTYNPFRQ
jgi:hypothetical protein